MKDFNCPPCTYCNKIEPDYKAPDNVDITCSQCVQVIVNFGITAFLNAREVLREKLARECGYKSI